MVAWEGVKIYVVIIFERRGFYMRQLKKYFNIHEPKISSTCKISNYRVHIRSGESKNLQVVMMISVQRD